jgi:hypothetical protein
VARIGENIMEKLMKFRQGTIVSQLRTSIVLFLLSVFVLSPAYAEKWQTTKFKIIQESPKIEASLIDNLNNNLWFYSAKAKLTTVKINQDLIVRLEKYLEKVAETYEKMGFKSPEITYENPHFIIYGYNYSDEKAPAANGCKFLRGKTSCILIFDLSRATATKFGVQLSPKIYEDLAHELFHAIQGSYSLFKNHSDLGDWIVEGTAEAMGIEMAEKIAGFKGYNNLVRWGGRRYHTPLRVRDDNPIRKDEGYWTASLWRYIGEYISNSRKPRSNEKGSPPNYRYLVKLFETNFKGKTNENKEISLIDKFLVKKTGKGLGEIYPNFITTFVHYVPDRVPGETREWLKCIFTGLNCKKDNIKNAAKACVEVELGGTEIEVETKAI